jgi:hypothetical protein
MGEAKRRQEAIRSDKCICGSGKAAGDCCFAQGHWHKHAAILGLELSAGGETLPNCYLAELASCAGGISGEHLISESVMRLLAGEGEFTIGGTPWLAEGEFRSVGFGSLTAKCLCERHNSALHPLDDAALSFFRSLRTAFEDETANARFIISGHDLERWLLKTLKAMAVSRNLGRGRERLTGEFTEGVNVAALLKSIEAWQPSTGLYCVMAAGEQTQNHLRFQLAPMTTDDGAISGLWASILGISFILMLEPLDLAQSPQARGAVHRPGEITVRYPETRSTIFLSWDDGGRHAAALSLEFRGKVTDV